MEEKEEYRLGTRFHVTVKGEKYDAILLFQGDGKAGLFTIPIEGLSWMKPISMLKLPTIYEFNKGEKTVEEKDIRNYILVLEKGAEQADEVEVILKAY